MKKALLSLLLAIACMPMAIGQNKSGQLVTTDTTVCSKFLWTVDSVEYTNDTVVLYQKPGDTTNTTYVLNLTMLDRNYDTVNVREISGNCVVFWNHKTWTEEGTFFDTITPARGCDTIVRVNITLNNADTTHETVTACDRYIFHGDTLTTSGTYTHVDTATATTDCHAYVVDLTIVNSFLDTANTVVRDIEGGCRVQWLGTTYTFGDTNEVFYGIGTTTVGGCDSLMAIRITSFTGVQHDTSFVESCGLYRWTVNNIAYTEDGVYTVTDTTSTCIENRHLALTIVDNHDTVTVTACEDYTYSFDARSGSGPRDHGYYNASGIYDTDENGDTLYSTHFYTGCKTYHTLDLTILTPEHREHPEVIDTTVCDAFVLSFGTAHTFTESVDTTLIRSLRTQKNCYDTIVHLDITVKHKSYKDYNITACDSYLWPFTNETYTTTTTQTITLDSIQNAEGCDSIGRLNLTINYTPEVTIEGNWHLNPDSTNIATLSAVDNAADHNTYKWFKNNESTPFSTAKDVTLTINGNTDVHLETTSNKGCTANNWITVTCHVGIDEVETLNVNLYPNPASRYLNVESSEGLSQIVIYNTLGQQVIVRNDINAAATQLDLGALATGHYTMQILTGNGTKATRTFIVNK